jgi:hypothetical protein
MLLRVMEGGVSFGPALDRPSGMILAKLAAMGSIDAPAASWAGANPPALSEAVRFSLMLEDDTACFQG